MMWKNEVKNAIFVEFMEKQSKIILNLHVVASALAADVTTPRFVIDSIKPPYTMLFSISNLSAPNGAGTGGVSSGPGTRKTLDGSSAPA